MDSPHRINNNRGSMFDIVSAGAGFFQSLATPHGAVVSIATFVGLSLVIAGSFARTMVRLRAFTVISNGFLLTAAWFAPNPVSVAFFLILLPLNGWRMIEITQLTRKVAAAARDGDTSGIWLKPYMKAERHRAGTVLFQRGDRAEALYLLVDGTIELVEVGKQQPAGEMFGEVAFFSPDRRRTLTARCASDCLVLSISESTFRQLYFQQPKFAFMVGSLIGQRLSADVQRLQASVAELQAQVASRAEVA
jgi:CRP/FNR family cyclic AMP-dependent transcriptional regulator